MILVNKDELNKYKILPFDLLNETGDLILKAGEVLTVGKLIQLRVHHKLYRKANSDEVTSPEIDLSDNSNVIFEDFSYENIEQFQYDTPINKYSLIEYKEQIKLKTYFLKTLQLLDVTSIQTVFPKIVNLREIIIKNVIPKFDEVKHYSELRLIGDYEVCHPINVAIMAGIIAKKMNFEKDFISDIILASILHDVGKTKIPKAYDSPASLSFDEYEEVKKHPIIGYNILKKELKLPDNICKVALQHHEHNDGTGYPYGTSSDWISIESKIVNICNYYDNLASNKLGVVIKNNRDVLRHMLSVGTKIFSAEILYTFIHMYSYNDIINFEDMETYSA